MKFLTIILFVITSIGSNDDTCTLPAPSGGSGTHNGTSVSISWNAVTSATGYRLVVTDLDTHQVIYDQQVSSTSQNVSGTDATHDYRSTIAPICSGGEASSNIIVVDVLGV